MTGVFTIAVWQLVQLGALVVLGFAAYKLYCRLDQRMENLKEACIDVAVELQTFGLRRLPRILRYFAVGDYSSIWGEIKSFAKEIKEGPDAVAKEFEQVFDNMLAYHLSTPAGLAYVQAQVAALNSAASTDTTAAVVGK